MRINTQVIFQWDNFQQKYISIYSEGYLYNGKIAECKYGRLRAQREAEQSAQRSYNLQQQELAFQREQLEKIEAGKASQEAQEAARKQKILALKRTGRASTIHTIEKKPQFADFEAKYRDENPMGEMSEEEYKKKMQSAYDQMQPFQRLIHGAPRLKKARVYA